MESRGGTDVFCPTVKRSASFLIDEEDPGHPGHHDHMIRVDPDDPDNVRLYESIDAFGFMREFPIVILQEKIKKGNKETVVDRVRAGRRRLTVLRRVNKARIAKKLEPHRPAVIFTDDPVVADSVSNASKPDPPLVRGRRFMLAAKSLGDGPAAAAEHLELSYAHKLAKIIRCPVPDLHDAVNRLLVPVDTAARAVDQGSVAVARILAASKNADGKVNPQKAKAAVKEAHEPKPKAKSADQHRAVADVVSKEGKGAPRWEGQEVAALVRWLGGDVRALDGCPALREQVEDALAKKKGKAAA